MRLAHLAATLALTALVACGQDMISPPPVRSGGPGSPSLSIGDGGGVTISTDSHDAHGDSQWLGTTLGPMVANLTISGLVNLNWTQASGHGTGSAGYFTPSGRWGPYGCYGYAQVAITYYPTTGGSTNVILPCDNANPYQKQYTFNGSYSAYRGSDAYVQIWGYCGYQQWPSDCVTYSGSQNVSIQRLPANLGLTSSKTITTPGTLVTFTGSANPSSIGSPSTVTPLTLESWDFSYDSGGGALCEMIAGTSCSVRVERSGTMRLTAIVNGERQYQTKRCSVVPCIKGESDVINDSEFRRLAQAALDSSGLDDPNPANRQEVAFEVWRRRSDSTLKFVWVGATLNDPCHVAVNLQDDNDSLTFEGFGHTHPARRGESVQNCDPKHTTLPYNPDANGGGSKADWGVGRINGFDVYVITPERVFILPKNTYEEDQGTNPYRWSRDTRTCHWL